VLDCLLDGVFETAGEASVGVLEGYYYYSGFRWAKTFNIYSFIIKRRLKYLPLMSPQWLTVY
jgi:hypothetical protein